MKRYRIPNTITAGVLVEWKNEYEVKVNLDFDGIFISTDNDCLIAEIIEVGGTIAKKEKQCK